MGCQASRQTGKPEGPQECKQQNEEVCTVGHVQVHGDEAPERASRRDTAEAPKAVLVALADASGDGHVASAEVGQLATGTGNRNLQRPMQLHRIDGVHPGRADSVRGRSRWHRPGSAADWARMPWKQAGAMLDMSEVQFDDDSNVVPDRNMQWHESKSSSQAVRSTVGRGDEEQPDGPVNRVHGQYEHDGDDSEARSSSNTATTTGSHAAAHHQGRRGSGAAAKTPHDAHPVPQAPEGASATQAPAVPSINEVSTTVDAGASCAQEIDDASQPMHVRWRKSGESIGKGAFGTVFLGLNEDTGELLAVKEIHFSPSHEREIQQLEHEINVMRSLEHTNIVRYLGAEVQDRRLFIFTEWMPGGSLAHVCDKFGALAEKIVRLYTRQVLVGLAYLHENNVIHRDIKGANILVDGEGVIKLADFGASRRLETLHTAAEQDGNVVHGSLRGTPYFMAPEIVTEQAYSVSSDVWAVGCTVLQLASGRAPWKSQRHNSLASLLNAIVSTPEGPPLSRSLSPQLRHFLQVCFARDPARRPAAQLLLQHPFIAGDLAVPAPLAACGHRDESLLAQLPSGSSMEGQDSVGLQSMHLRAQLPAHSYVTEPVESPAPLPVATCVGAGGKLPRSSSVNMSGFRGSRHGMPHPSGALHPRRHHIDLNADGLAARNTSHLTDGTTAASSAETTPLPTPLPTVTISAEGDPGWPSSSRASSVSMIPDVHARTNPVSSPTTPSTGVPWSFVPGGWYIMPPAGDAHGAPRLILQPPPPVPDRFMRASEQLAVAGERMRTASHASNDEYVLPPVRIAKASVSISMESGAATSPPSGRMESISRADSQRNCDARSQTPSGHTPAHLNDACASPAVVVGGGALFVRSPTSRPPVPSRTVDGADPRNPHSGSPGNASPAEGSVTPVPARRADIIYVSEADEQPHSRRRLFRGTTGVLVTNATLARSGYGSRREPFNGFVPSLAPITASNNESRTASESAVGTTTTSVTASMSARFTQLEVAQTSLSDRQRPFRGGPLRSAGAETGAGAVAAPVASSHHRKNVDARGCSRQGWSSAVPRVLLPISESSPAFASASGQGSDAAVTPTSTRQRSERPAPESASRNTVIEAPPRSIATATAVPGRGVAALPPGIPQSRTQLPPFASFALPHAHPSYPSVSRAEPAEILLQVHTAASCPSSRRSSCPMDADQTPGSTPSGSPVLSNGTTPRSADFTRHDLREARGGITGTVTSPSMSEGVTPTATFRDNPASTRSSRSGTASGDEMGTTDLIAMLVREEHGLQARVAAQQARTPVSASGSRVPVAEMRVALVPINQHPLPPRASYTAAPLPPGISIDNVAPAVLPVGRSARE